MSPVNTEFFIDIGKGLKAQVDEQDYEFLSRWKWKPQFSYNSVYAVRSGMVNGKRKHFAMHRQIMGFPILDVDHKDGNGLNNRRSNLRTATDGQNQANQTIRKQAKTSRFKGVSKRDRDKAWRAAIQINGARIYLGSFFEESEAAKAYDQAARKAWGEYAFTNFPEPQEPPSGPQK